MDQGLSEFQQTVLSGLSNLREGMAQVKTKMDFLVGPDGTNGRVGQLEDDVDSLKQSRSRDRGIFAVIAFVASAIASGAGWIFHGR